MRLTTTISKTALIALSLTAFTSVATAQDDGLGGMESANEETSSMEDMSAMEDSSTTTPAVAASSGDTSGFHKMAISTTFPTGGDGGAANLLWGLDANTYLDLSLGISYGPGVPVAGAPAGDDIFGIRLGAGYRMYRDASGKIRPYIEPGVGIDIPDLSNAGDTLGLAVGAVAGIDYALMEQFTLGTGLGAELAFLNSFDTIEFGLFTLSINATFWW